MFKREVLRSDALPQTVTVTFVLIGCALLFVATGSEARAGEKDKAATGIELSGRSAKEPPPYCWYVDDARGKKRIAEVYKRWGFTPLPPGEYVVTVRQNDSEVPFATVQVTKDKVTRVEVTSGIEVVGRSEKEPPLYYWYVADAKTKKRLAEVYKRWGFT